MLGIGDLYLKFFVKNIDSRWVVIQGGRRSGKSWAIHRWLHFLASGKSKTVMVVTASYPQLQLAISDFEKSTGITTWMSQKHGRTALLSNGSRWLFRSFDRFDKAQGSACDYLFIEEALQFPEQIISTLSMSVTTQIYCAYNPSSSNSLADHIKEDKSNYLKTTYKDNPYLSDSQLEEFYNIERKAALPGASTIDIFARDVYCRGEFGNLGGKVFKTIYTCTMEEYIHIPTPELFGLDFGLVDSADETALVGIKIWQGKLYIREIIYSDQLANNKDLAWSIINHGLTIMDNIVADYGGMGKSRINKLVSADDGEWTESPINQGFNIQAARKTKIIEGLQEMMQYQIFLTDDSPNLRKQMERYELTPTGSPKGTDHLIDAARYATHAWKLNYCY